MIMIMMIMIMIMIMILIMIMIMIMIMILIILRTIAMELRTSCDEFMESNLVPVDISSLIGFYGVNKVSIN